MHAYICEKKPRQFEATRQLSIGDQGIAFFIEPLMGVADFTSSASENRWHLKFFTGSPFEQELFVCLDPEQDEIKWVLGKACYLNNGGNSEQNDALREEASTFLRNSQTLNLDQGRQLTSTRMLIADRDGFAYFSSDQNQFKRIVLCQALAVAYKKVLYECMTLLTQHVRADSVEETLTLYENILRFNAADYFSLPVQLERHELFAAWQVLAEHYKLNQLSNELTQQLSQVATLLQAKRERERTEQENLSRSIEETRRHTEDKRDKRRNTWLAAAGVLLTGTSLLSLVQITPKHFSEAKASWGAALFGSSAVGEAASDAAAPIAAVPTAQSGARKTASNKH